jgi:hypothetical protein
MHGPNHHHPHESYSSRPHPEFVVLDIGGDVGALIVHTEPALHGVEIEISPSGRDGARTHKDVLERRMGGHPAHTAVFDELREGSYTLWVGGEPRSRDVAVRGGAITEVDWRSLAPAA